MASLKLEHHASDRQAQVDFHDRKVMASLKPDGWPPMYSMRSNFHDRKVMASLKHEVHEGDDNSQHDISMIGRSWPH